MAALANATTTASINDLIHTEQIEEVILMAAKAPAIAESIAWRCDASEGGSATYKWAREDGLEVPAGTKTETDEFTNVEYTTSSSTATAGTVGLSSPLSDEAKIHGRRDATPIVVSHIAAMRRRSSTDVLTLITSATNTSDNSGSNLSLANWAAALAAFRAQQPQVLPGGFPAFVGSNNQFRDFMAAIMSSGSTIFATGLVNQFFNQGLPEGYRGSFMGIDLFESALVPQFDGANDSGAFLIANEGGALGLAIWKPITSEGERLPNRATDRISTHAIYGVGITAQHNLREFVSKKAA